MCPSQALLGIRAASEVDSAKHHLAGHVGIHAIELRHIA